MTNSVKVLVRIAFPVFIIMLGACQDQPEHQAASAYPITPIDIKNVVLTDSFWLPKIKMIQEVTIMHAFQKCAEEGRMDNFLIAGKKMEGKARGAMPFDDTDLYKIIEGASYSLVSMPNPTLDAYMDSIISIIKIGQEPDGYITTWFTIDKEHPPANWVKPSKERWENEISSHELYNSGHLFEAAAAHYWVTGKKDFLDIALKNADLLVTNFKPGLQQKPPGHQIAETGLIKLYDITHKKEYLNLAKYLIDLRGDSTTHKLYGAYNQDHVPVIKQSEAVGHAVRAEYLYAGMTDIAAYFRDTSYLNALDRIWDNTVNTKTYITGGVGAIHDGERFGMNYELPNLTAYAETCASIGSVWWNQKMFNLTGDVKYYDILERTLYNGLISGISTDGKLFFYTNPMESDGEYKFNRGAGTRQSWFDCSCCPTNMIRFLPSLPGLIYASKNDTVYTNLFISSEAHLKINDGDVKISQQTGYPWNGKVLFKIEPEKKSKFSFRVRIPEWFRNEAIPGTLYTYVDAPSVTVSVLVNGAKATTPIEDGYITMTREWNTGDQVEFLLSMQVRKIRTNELVKENVNKVAYEYGPLVYCAEEVDNKNIASLSLPSDADWKVSNQKLLGESVNLLQTEVNQENVTLIPYYLWSNRGENKMKVWLRESGN